jgi:hypothetical protein
VIPYGKWSLTLVDFVNYIDDLIEDCCLALKRDTWGHYTKRPTSTSAVS